MRNVEGVSAPYAGGETFCSFAWETPSMDPIAIGCDWLCDAAIARGAFASTIDPPLGIEIGGSVFFPGLRVAFAVPESADDVGSGLADFSFGTFLRRRFSQASIKSSIRNSTDSADNELLAECETSKVS